MKIIVVLITALLNQKELWPEVATQVMDWHLRDEQPNPKTLCLVVIITHIYVYVSFIS